MLESQARPPSFVEGDRYGAVDSSTTGFRPACETSVDRRSCRVLPGVLKKAREGVCFVEVNFDEGASAHEQDTYAARVHYAKPRRNHLALSRESRQEVDSRTQRGRD